MDDDRGASARGTFTTGSQAAILAISVTWASIPGNLRFLHRGPKTPKNRSPMRPYARRLLLSGLLATAWSGAASAAPDLPRAPSPEVPLEPAPPSPQVSEARSAQPAANSQVRAPTPALAPAQVVAVADEPTAMTEEHVSARSTAASGEAPRPAPKNSSGERARPPRSSRSGRALELVPRQFGLELGWSNLAIDNLPDALIPDPRPHPHGVSSGAHVLWQIAGLSHRWPTWIGPLIGLDVFPASPVSRRVIAASYGFQFKHQFGRQPRVRPFLSYGVGAVQTWVKTIPGREIGHQLRASFGSAFPVAKRSALTLAFVYKYQGLATFRWDDAGTLAYNFHTIGLVAGITLDAPARRSRARNRGKSRQRERPPDDGRAEGRAPTGRRQRP